jgi:hypothetical protein
VRPTTIRSAEGPQSPAAIPTAPDRLSKVRPRDEVPDSNLADALGRRTRVVADG